MKSQTEQDIETTLINYIDRPEWYTNLLTKDEQDEITKYILFRQQQHTYNLIEELYSDDKTILKKLKNEICVSSASRAFAVLYKRFMNKDEEYYSGVRVLKQNNLIYFNTNYSYMLDNQIHDGGHTIVDISKFRVINNAIKQIQQQQNADIICLGRDSYILLKTKSMYITNSLLNSKLLFNNLLNIMNIYILALTDDEKQKLADDLSGSDNEKPKYDLRKIIEIKKKIDSQTLLNNIPFEIKEKYKARIKTLEETVKNKIMEIDNEMNTINILKSKLLFLDDKSTNITHDLDRTLQHFVDTDKIYDYTVVCEKDLYSRNVFLNITIYTKILPICYVDIDLVNELIKRENRSFPERVLSEKKKEHWERVTKYELNFATVPQIVKIRYDLCEGKFSISGSQLPSNIDIIDTNHAINYHLSFRCLGTFEPEMIAASKDYNMSKLLYLLMQYLQSASPNDLAGNKTLYHALYVDSEKQYIEDVNGTKLELKNIIYTKNSWEYNDNGNNKNNEQ